MMLFEPPDSALPLGIKLQWMRAPLMPGYHYTELILTFPVGKFGRERVGEPDGEIFAVIHQVIGPGEYRVEPSMSSEVPILGFYHLTFIQHYQESCLAFPSPEQDVQRKFGDIVEQDDVRRNIRRSIDIVRMTLPSFLGQSRFEQSIRGKTIIPVQWSFRIEKPVRLVRRINPNSQLSWHNAIGTGTSPATFPERPSFWLAP